ncbi:hypothetical protein HAX54_041600, partial [Datura stramonium]|nr:hypothetical protein [Datura stramonium]
LMLPRGFESRELMGKNPDKGKLDVGEDACSGENVHNSSNELKQRRAETRRNCAP